MKLFDDVALFDAGKPRFTEFSLPGTELMLWEQLYTKEAADRYFNTLLSSTPWKQRYRKMYDKKIPDPRLTAFYGGETGLLWTESLLEIKQKIEETCGVVFNCVLLNYYRNGNDSVAWHSDTLPADCKHHAIGSVTFGETRHFKVRHKTDNAVPQLDIPLMHGSFLLMGETMQDHYEHHVPKTAKEIGGRINLTFRIDENSRLV